MKIDIGPLKGVQVRTQTRTVTTTDFIYKGKVIASGQSILNPLDEFDEEVGTRKSALRAVADIKYKLTLWTLATGEDRGDIYTSVLQQLSRKVTKKFKKIHQAHERFLEAIKWIVGHGGGWRQTK